MNEGYAVVKYHNRCLLLTVDLHTLVNTLFDFYGDDLTIHFVAMSELERERNISKLGMIDSILDRFQVFEVNPKIGERRRPDIERAAIAAGAK
jgi:hypothetical protein